MLISSCVQGGPMPGMRPTIGGPGTQPQQPKVRQYKLYTNQPPDTCYIPFWGFIILLRLSL